MTRRDPDALDQREYAFCIAYTGAAAGNGTDAARIAGYKGGDKSLGVQAARLLGRARVQDYIKTLNDQQERKGVLLKANRLKRRQERWEQIQAEITARAAQSWQKDDATAATGIIGREPRANGLYVHVADTALLKLEMDLEKQVAIELGEWTERVEQSVNVSGDVPIIEIVVELDTAGRQRAETEEADLDAIDWDGEGETPDDADPSGMALDDWDDEPHSEDIEDDEPF